MASAAPIQNRPYRSHKVPACTRCRSRKIRCHIDIPGEPCLSCRERRLKCQYVESSTTSSPTDDGSDRRPSKRRRHSEPEDGPSRPRSAPILHKTNNNPSASIMLAPHFAEDIDIFNRHISQHRKAEGEVESSNYQTLLHDAKDPVVYLTVPRFRTGLPPNSGCGREQLEIVEQIMGPFKREVVELYFNHIHYHFPILDEEMCETLRRCPDGRGGVMLGIGGGAPESDVGDEGEFQGNFIFSKGGNSSFSSSRSRTSLGFSSTTAMVLRRAPLLPG